MRNGYARRSAERVARDIELDIIEEKLVAGDSLGSESELMERFGVSRGVVREAVCLVEHHMLAETRRGAGGGLIVAEPNVSVITEIASLYLARNSVSVSDLFETRVLLETKALEGVVATLDQQKIDLLRQEASRTVSPTDDLAQEAEGFHLLLAELSGNGVLGMLVPILSGLVKEVWSAHHRMPTESEHRAIWKRVCTRHTKIAEAIIAGDLPKARIALTKHLLQISDDLEPNLKIIAPLEMPVTARVS
jgi:DNA-binding FadR family transcriptional regulator